MPKFLAELQRRNVIRVAIAYLAVGWLILQAGDVLTGMFELKPAILRAVLLILLLGFVPALVFAWVYELTPEGLRRDGEVDPAHSITHLTGRKLDRLVIGVLFAIVGLLLFDRFVPGLGHTPAPPAPLEAAGTPADPPVSATDARESIAVLPFADMSQARDQEYFSDGLSEELLNLLAQIPQLRVIARTSSFSFKGKDVDVATIAKTLGVKTVLEGSVRKAGDRLRVTAQLIRAADSSHLWSETYDRELTDVFKLQDEIAGAVVEALKVKLLPAQAVSNHTHGTANPAAYDQFLIARQFLRRITNTDSVNSALKALDAAIALDPGYAEAHIERAVAQVNLAIRADDDTASTAALQEALASANRAISLAPDLAGGYAVRGATRSIVDPRSPETEADLERALALDPHDSRILSRYAFMLDHVGRYPEAIVAYRKALELDPLSSVSWSALGMSLIADGQFGEARRALGRALELNPGWTDLYQSIGNTELLDAKPQAALDAYRRTSDNLYSRTGIAMAEHSLGHAAESQRMLERLIAENAGDAAYQIAEVHAWRGEKDAAFEWLERGRVQKDPGLLQMKTDRALIGLHGDPRYADLVRKIDEAR